MTSTPTATADSGESLETRCRRIELLVSDVDGVMTDGVIAIDDHGVESKHFHVRDGSGFVLWHRAGKQSAIISGRKAEAVNHRAKELGIGRVYQGVANKSRPFRSMLGELGLDPSRACFVGDDLADLSIFGIGSLGLAACPADAAPEVIERAHLVTRGIGGRGVVREVVETILKAQGRWNQLIDGYLTAND